MAVVDAKTEAKRAPSPAAKSDPPPAAPAPPGYHPCVIVLAAAAGGILADHSRPMPATAWYAISAAALIGWFLLLRWLLKIIPHGRRQDAPAIVLLLAVAALAAGWHHDRWNLFGGDDLGLFARSQQQPVCIEAVALQTPRLIPQPEYNPLRSPHLGEEIRFEIELHGIRDGDQWRTASGRAAMVVEGRVPNLAAGDSFQAFAHLLPPDHALNPGEPDRAALDRGRRITSHLRVTHPEAISRVSSGFGFGLGPALDSIRMRGRQVFAQYL
jgi:competence protein ComEC